MDFQFSAKSRALNDRVQAFMDEHVYPNEARYQHERRTQTDRTQRVALVEELKAKARAAGLWNFFSQEIEGGLSNVEYAPLAEIMGRVAWASEVFNCAPPDSGNMETLARYGSPAQKERWLKPLMAGEIRSAFSMTEPDVASSDAANIRTSIRRDGDEYVINGRKWYTGGAMAAACRVLVVMGVTDPNHPDRHKRQSMILVPKETPGVTIERDLHVFGYDDHPNGHPVILYDNVRVPASNILLGEGRGFEIAQGRLGPGRVHHCMRAIGQAEVALEKTCIRISGRVAFGKPIGQQGIWRERVARARMMIDQARLLVLRTADKIDREGNKDARKDVSMIKVVCAEMVTQITDWAIQAHGAAGMTDEYGNAQQYVLARGLRIADGPDEVHTNLIGKLELQRYAKPAT